MDKAIPKISYLIKVKQLGKLTGTSFQNHLVGDFRGSRRKKNKSKKQKKKKRNILSDFINSFYKAIFFNILSFV